MRQHDCENKSKEKTDKLCFSRIISKVFWFNKKYGGLLWIAKIYFLYLYISS